jgi:hypothetical protein
MLSLLRKTKTFLLLKSNQTCGKFKMFKVGTSWRSMLMKWVRNHTTVEVVTLD